MAFDLTGLSTYTDEQKNDLIRESLLKYRSVEFMTVQPNIKSIAAINILSQNPLWTAGSCGFTSTGTTSLTQRDITVCDIKKNESLCVNDLEEFWIQSRMKPGSYNEQIPFEELYTNEVVGQTQKMFENLTWQGNVTGGTGSNILCNGFLQLLDGERVAGNVVTSAGNSTTGFTAANIIATIDAMVAAIPADMVDADDVVLFIGYGEYRTYSLALRNANLFHYTGAEDQGGEFSQMVPGTNVRVVGVGGLTGLGRAVLGEAKNFVVGVDLMSDSEDFRIFYSADNDEVRVIQKFKIGFQVAFPGRIVISV